ncbi:MAG: hypothetical protein ACEPO8_12785 [Rhodothermaceae bacterium]
MKNLLVLIVVLMLGVTFAENAAITKNHPKFDQIEKNLINNTKSENHGVLYSSIIMLGEIKSENAVMSLAKILRGNYSNDLKIVSALSLAKIGTDYSKYIVRRVAELSDDKKTSELLRKFYFATK